MKTSYAGRTFSVMVFVSGTVLQLTCSLQTLMRLLSHELRKSVSHFMVLMCGTLFRLTCGLQIYLWTSSETDWKPRENFMLNRRHYYYYNPAIRSIGRDTKFTVAFFIHYARLQISQPGLYRSAWNFAWLFGHISDRSSISGWKPRGWLSYGHQHGAYGRVYFLLKHLLLLLYYYYYFCCVRAYDDAGICIAKVQSMSCSLGTWSCKPLGIRAVPRVQLSQSI